MENIHREKQVWLFNSGASLNGNPKWLFIYMNKFRKDIKCIWLSENEKVHKEVSKLGYEVVLMDSIKGRKIQSTAGVYVVNQVKEYLPETMRGILILNLWHGVGGKTIERKLNFSYIRERVAKKYIKYNEIYTNNQLFLVTSEFMEDHFKEHCGLENYQLIRAGYPCNEIPNKYPELKRQQPHIKNTLNSYGKIIVYAPTYRYDNPDDFFKKAMPDMEQLKEVLEKNNILFIFKMHPMMEKDSQYQLAKEKYREVNQFLFWDNSIDIYEYFDLIDLAIVDYSSIYYDMVSAGVTNYIRYVFDFENKENVEGLIFNYLEKTTGEICNDFSELIQCIEKGESKKDMRELQNIHSDFWSYSNQSTVETIIEETLKYNINPKKLKTLYSFDVFDTLIQRKTLEPKGIFYYVKELAQESELNFPSNVLNNYIEIRITAEANVREYYNKSQMSRNSDKIEITFDEIFERIQDVYLLSYKQIEFLKAKEIEAELINCELKIDIANFAEELIKEGNDVVLISDMYLSKSIIRSMLGKVSPILSRLPLYVSSEYGNRKINKKLFLDVYDDVDYRQYSEWRHFGDNMKGDGESPAILGIQTDVHKISKFNRYERYLINNLNSYDSYKIATLFARYRENEVTTKSYFSYSIVSLYFVPYVHWVLKNAIKNNIKTLYFLSRDGHHLKKIAETLIEEKSLNIKVKYIYGSRKAWRIPSFIDNIDEEYFGNFGNFTGVRNYEDLKKALAIDDKMFNEIFVNYHYIKDIKEFSLEERRKIINFIKSSKEYEIYLLDVAKEKRRTIQKYLRQEINFDEKFAFVEYWGRGYTQSCLNRIINDIESIDVDTVFYYVRSIYPSFEKNIRKNFTTSTYSLNFIEAIFANIPYKSIEDFKMNTNGIVEPVIKENRDYDAELFKLMEEELINFTRDYATCELLSEDDLIRVLFEGALKFYHKYPNDIAFKECLSSLKYNEGMYGSESEFARAFKYSDIIPLIRGQKNKLKTNSIKMSLANSPKLIQKAYLFKKSNTFKRLYKFYSSTFRRLIK